MKKKKFFFVLKMLGFIVFDLQNTADFNRFLEHFLAREEKNKYPLTTIPV